MRKVLHTLVTQGGILLHGSPNLLEEIHPHFADGEIAICATTFPELAIIMGVFKACGPCRMSYVATHHKGTYCIKISMCEKALAALLYDDPIAYVYSIDAEDFSKKSPFEYRLYDSIYTQKRIAVSKKDLPFMPVSGQTNYTVILNRQLASVLS